MIFLISLAIVMYLLSEFGNLNGVLLDGHIFGAQLHLAVLILHDDPLQPVFVIHQGEVLTEEPATGFLTHGSGLHLHLAAQDHGGGLMTGQHAVEVGGLHLIDLGLDLLQLAQADVQAVLGHVNAVLNGAHDVLNIVDDLDGIDALFTQQRSESVGLQTGDGSVIQLAQLSGLDVLGSSLAANDTGEHSVQDTGSLRLKVLRIEASLHIGIEGSYAAVVAEPAEAAVEQTKQNDKAKNPHKRTAAEAFAHAANRHHGLNTSSAIHCCFLLYIILYQTAMYTCG